MVNNYVFIDLETTGLDRKTDKIILGGFKLNDQPTYVEYPPFTRETRILLENVSNNIVGHNVLFDVAFLEKEGIKVSKRLLDTRILAFARWPFHKLKLKTLGQNILGQTVLELKTIKGRGKIEDIAKPILEGYCKQDVELTCTLFKLLYPVRSHWVDTVEFKLTEIIHEIEKRGLYVDIEYLRTLHGLWEGEIKNITGRYSINLNSPKQIQEYLRSRGFTNKSTDKVSLISSKDRIPECEEILKYRELSTLVGRYTGPFLKQQNNGYIYGEFNQAGQEKNEFAVKTGRLSSSNPNLQNIPTRTVNGKNLRKCFIAPPGFRFVVADASQIEPRFVAFFTKDPTLRSIFTNNLDFHGIVTQIAYAKSFFTPEERFVGKTLGLATMYGASAHRLMLELRKYGVFLPLDEVEKRQTNIKLKFHSVIDWARKFEEETRVKGYFSTYGGRRYPYSSDAAIFNNFIQASQADYIKLCCLGIEEQGHKIVNTIHDEILVYTKEVEKSILDINNTMSSVIHLGDIPIKTDVKEVKSWSEK